MPIENIWLVTQSIRDMIKARTQPLMGATVTTTAEAPQAITGGTNLVSVYLFHLLEDAHYKNQPSRSGSSSVPIQQVPIGLNLYYVITTLSPGTTDPEQRGELEQKLLGLSAKAIHDQPVLAVGSDEHFQLILRPVPIEEAITFWSSDSSETANLTRPSLFVEARVILLEREPPETLSGTVLSVGSFVLVGAGPQLTSSRNALTFLPPGFPAQEVRAEPARVALFRPLDTPYATVPAPDVVAKLNENNRLTLVGSQFGSGRRLLELERGAVRVRLDLSRTASDNPIWELTVTPGAVTLRCWTSAVDADSHSSVPLLPGIYTARVLVDVKPRPRPSNRIAFAVVPQVKGVSSLGANQYSLSIMGDYLLAPELEVQLAVGSEILEFDAGPSPAQGKFTLPAGGETLIFHRTPVPGETVDSAHPVSVNLSVNGAQATPAWITVAP